MRTFGSPRKKYLFSFFKIMEKFVFNAKLVDGKLKFFFFMATLPSRNMTDSGLGMEALIRKVRL